MYTIKPIAKLSAKQATKKQGTPAMKTKESSSKKRQENENFSRKRCWHTGHLCRPRELRKY
jgi:hypothetical protein